MLRYKFENLCTKALSGQHYLVRNQMSFEEGLVTSCIIKSHSLVVKTTDGEIRCWKYHDCYEVH
mgnify:CR=1 FL=1